MLQNHQQFLSRVSIKVSERLRKEFYIGLQKIIENPYAYPYLDKRKTYRRYLFYKRYLIVYLIEKNRIYVEYILDVRQNYFNQI